MANTVIQLKYSTATSKPPLLNVAEPAYSNVSGVLWIDDGTGVVAIGGVSYTTKIDNATSANTGNTLVLRDIDGSFSANVLGADSIVVGPGTNGNIAGANTVYANYFFGSLATPTGVTEDTYGSSTEIPIITVSANGLISNVTTAAISTTLSFTGDTGGPNTLNLIDGTLTFTGGNGIATAITANTVTFDVDDTVFRSNTEGATQIVQTDVQISGNLIVQGSTTYVNTSINQTTDSMIELGANNTIGDVLDIGFYGLHGNTETSGVDITGLVRNAGTSDYYLFDRVNVDDEADINANTLAQAFTTANGASLYAKQFLAADIGLTGGYSFNTGTPTGMFSEADGRLQFYVNGTIAGEINSNNGNTAIGLNAASNNQGYRATAIGYEAGKDNQGSWSTAIGLKAATLNQGNSSVAVGHRAGSDYQGKWTVAVGVNSGQNTQGIGATSLGYRAGYGGTTSQGTYAVALGAYAGVDSQHEYSIAINASGDSLNPTEEGFYVKPIRANNAVGGNVTVYNTTTKEVVSTDITINNSGITLANGTVISDGESGLFVDALNANTTSNVVFYDTITKELTYGTISAEATHVANGAFIWTVDNVTGALYSDQGTYIADSANSVVIGQNVDVTNSNPNRVAIGNYAGNTTQGYGSTAVGDGAGSFNQGYLSVAIGTNAGNDNQQHSSVAVGHTAGRLYQGQDAVAVGVAAGQNTQGQFAVAIGERAGYGGTTSQGQYSIAIGAHAGYNSQHEYSIALNASGSALDPTQSGFYVNPVRYVETQDATYDGIAFYNSSTKELTYSYVLSGGSF